MTTASEPRRVQWRRGMPPMPPNTRYVGRTSRFGNPYRVDPLAVDLAAEHRRVCRLFAAHLAAHPELVDVARRELTGRNLACGCGPVLPCHVDVWLAVLYGPGLRARGRAGARPRARHTEP
jgi:hypothetical protein